VDLRTAWEVDHGRMETAVNVPLLDGENERRSSDDYGEEAQALYLDAASRIAESPLVDKEKQLILVCAKGINSEGVADKLGEMGLRADSLEGGYIAWLLDKCENENDDNFCADVEKSLRKKFRKNIWCKFTKAINEYELVKPGDRIAVCISGGKDSMLMAKLFQELKIHNKFDFTVKFLVMDPGYSPENRKVIEDNARKLNVPINIFESDIFDSVYNVEKSPCYLCARMRRGHLYAFAKELGCNKIALGHHYDDVIETILMGMLYGAQMQTMMPKLHSTNFEGMELIRPLYLIREDDIKAWRDYNGLHFIQCACKFTDTCTTCNNEENQSKRIEIKNLIASMKKTNPFVESNIFRSVENVNLDTLVAYKSKGVKHHFLDEY
jgi:tRNA(Ile)-lysidine synthase TilS/MesJ/rhodanese-related sulfurtransferase